jgi:hypothetical protein
MAETNVRMGHNIIVKVAVNGQATALLKQQSARFTRKRESVQVEGKADYPNVKRLQSWLDWQLTCDQLMCITDGAFDALEAAQEAGAEITVYWFEGGVEKHGQALLAEIGSDGPIKGSGTRSYTFEAADGAFASGGASS